MAPWLFELTLPWPPSVNHVWRRGRNGNVYLDPRVEGFRLGVLVACRKQGVVSPRLSGRLAVEVDCYQPQRMTRLDLGNLDKALMDSLTAAGVWVDDEQIDDVRYRRCDRHRDGLVVVRLREIGATA